MKQINISKLWNINDDFMELGEALCIVLDMTKSFQDSTLTTVDPDVHKKRQCAIDTVEDFIVNNFEE